MISLSTESAEINMDNHFSFQLITESLKYNGTSSCLLCQFVSIINWDVENVGAGIDSNIHVNSFQPSYPHHQFIWLFKSNKAINSSAHLFIMYACNKTVHQ